jgi:putative ABC transport system permease protein
MLHNWIKYLYTPSLKQQTVLPLNVLGLSIGIAGLILTLLYWNDEQSYDDGT